MFMMHFFFSFFNPLTRHGSILLRFFKAKRDIFMMFLHMSDDNVFFSGYPWTENDNVVKWLYIPDFRSRPNPLFLICEFYS